MEIIGRDCRWRTYVVGWEAFIGRVGVKKSREKRVWGANGVIWRK